MESIKEQFFIEDYSVSQTTLEQVFLNFARAQRPPREQRGSCGKRCCDCCTFVCCCCCRSNMTAPQPPVVQHPIQAVMVAQPPPGTAGPAPAANGYTNVGYIGEQNKQPEVTYVPDSENINMSL